RDLLGYRQRKFVRELPCDEVNRLTVKFDTGKCFHGPFVLNREYGLVETLGDIIKNGGQRSVFLQPGELFSSLFGARARDHPFPGKAARFTWRFGGGPRLERPDGIMNAVAFDLGTLRQQSKNKIHYRPCAASRRQGLAPFFCVLQRSVELIIGTFLTADDIAG